MRFIRRPIFGGGKRFLPRSSSHHKSKRVFLKQYSIKSSSVHTPVTLKENNLTAQCNSSFAPHISASKDTYSSQTNVAHTAYLNSQFDVADVHCVNELCRFRFEASKILQRRIASEKRKYFSLQNEATSLLEDAIDMRTTIEAFAPVPKVFVETHIRSLLNEYSQQDKTINRVRPCPAHSLSMAETHDSKRRAAHIRIVNALRKLTHASTSNMLKDNNPLLNDNMSVVETQNQLIQLDQPFKKSSFIPDLHERINEYADHMLFPYLLRLETRAGGLTASDIKYDNERVEHLQHIRMSLNQLKSSTSLIWRDKNQKHFPLSDISRELVLSCLKKIKGLSVEHNTITLSTPIKTTQHELLNNISSQDDLSYSNPLLLLWKQLDASLIKVYNVLCPATFKNNNTLTSYMHTRHSASLFDFPFKRVIRFYGKDYINAGLKFLACSPSLDNLQINDARYCTLLDFTGKILDDCWVIKNETDIQLIVSGFEFQTLHDYLCLALKQLQNKYDLECNFEVIQDVHIVSLQGPKTSKILNELVHYSQGVLNTSHSIFLSTVPPIQYQLTYTLLHSNSVSHEIGQHQPYMSQGTFHFTITPYANKDVNTIIPSHTTSIQAIRIGITGEDGFEFICPKKSIKEFVSLLLWHRDCHEGGLLSWNMLRMEAGFCLMGYDLTRQETPIQASLLTTIDHEKLRQHVLFGSLQMLHQLSRMRTTRRVGLICDEPVPNGSLIVSFPKKIKLGTVRSTAWSPLLCKRLAMGMISNEYACVGQQVLLRYHHIKNTSCLNKIKHSSYQFIMARVVQLPFISHRIKTSVPLPGIVSIGHRRKDMLFPKYNGIKGLRKIRGRSIFQRNLPTLFEKKQQTDV